MSQLSLLVLAAGEGKRIKPIVTSKPLIPFMGKSLIERVVESARILKPKELVITVNEKNKEQVSRLLPQAQAVVQEDIGAGMAGAVLAAKSLFAGPAVVVNGDDLVGEKIVKDFKAQIDKTPDRLVLTGVKKDLTGGYFDRQGPSLKVVEKPQGSKPSEWAKIVLDYFPKIEDFIFQLESIKSSRDNIYEQALNRMPNPILVKAEGGFVQLKYPHQVLDITEYLLKTGAGVDKSAKIFPGARIVNSYIGPNVVVGNNALVRDSIVEAGSEIGFCTEVARSYVGPKSFCHTNYIGDSVIEGEVNFGAGAVLANFRFDHKKIGITGRTKFGAVVGRGAQIGVNASLMPGALVKAGATVGPGAVRK